MIPRQPWELELELEQQIPERDQNPTSIQVETRTLILMNERGKKTNQI